MNAMLFDVTPLEAKDFPDDLELSILFMVLQTVFSTNVAERLMEIYQKLQPTLHLPETQKEWQDALFYTITSATHFPPQEYKKVIKQTEKEGIISMSTSLLDVLVAEREANGEAKFGRGAVLNVLRIRFKQVPKSIETAVQQMNDPIALQSLNIRAATCQTLDEFAEDLN